MMLSERITDFEFNTRINAADEALKQSMVWRIVCTECCKRNCLRSSHIGDVVKLVTACQEEINALDRRQKKDYMLQKIRNCFNKRHNVSGYASFSWKLGVAPNIILKDVCRKCFMNVYSVSHGYLDSIVFDIKGGARCYDDKSNNRTPCASTKFVETLKNLAARYGIELSLEHIQALKVPNTFASLTAFSWMCKYFESCGEPQPNGNEIHLDPCTVKHMYEEYVIVYSDVGEVIVVKCNDFNFV